MVFRKETFDVIFHYYLCEDSGEHFTTTQLDELNLNQLYNKYRDKFNIPFPDEISRIRKMYGLSASKMSNFLGLGPNTYRQYESGEMPTIASARLIHMAGDPRAFIEMVRLCDFIDSESINKVIGRAEVLAEERERGIFDFNVKNYLLGSALPDIYSGYRTPDFEKFSQMVLFFSEFVKPFKTKLNKLLFYSDFLNFKENGYSISGVRYCAIDLGPVPHNFQGIFEYLANHDIIDIVSKSFPDGGIGEKFMPGVDRAFDASFFSDREKDVLTRIVEVFGKSTTDEIVNRSHSELGWIENKEKKGIISYEYAFYLSRI